MVGHHLRQNITALNLITCKVYQSSLMLLEIDFYVHLFYLLINCLSVFVPLTQTDTHCSAVESSKRSLGPLTEGGRELLGNERMNE